MTVIVNIDVLPPITDGDVLAMCSEAIRSIGSICGGEIKRYVLSANNSVVTFGIP
jgi:hypothetical protein